MRDEGYTFVNVRDIASTSDGTRSRSVALSFDDGLANNVDVAADVLAGFNASATFFIATKTLGQHRTVTRLNPIGPPACFMSSSDVRALTRFGFEIGSHSHSHTPLRQLSPGVALADLVKSRTVLEEVTEAIVVSFAYPHGHRRSFSDETRESVQRAGFVTACTQVTGSIVRGTDRLRLPRTGISGFDTVHDLKRKLTGQYDWTRHITEALY